MLKTVICLALIFSLNKLNAQTLSAELCPVQSVSLRISQINEDVIRFEVCRGGSCSPLGSAPGYYRISDITSRRSDLRERLRAQDLKAKIRNNVVNIGFTVFGCIGVAASSFFVYIHAPAYREAALASAITFSSLGVVIDALLPYSSILWRIHEVDREQDQTLGKALRRGNRPMSEAQLLHFISQLDRALKLVPVMDPCEVELLSPNPSL